MLTYELRFELPELSEETEDAVADVTGGVICCSSGVVTVRFDSEGSDFEEAVNRAVERLRGIGVQPIELLADLVSRSEIARRAGVSRQAVALWTSGARRRGRFPTPYTDASGGLWLWEDVAPALRNMGIEVDEGVSFPTRAELFRACAQVAEKAERLVASSRGCLSSG